MLATALRLPRADGTLAPYVPSTAARHSFAPQPPPRTRVVYAAAHVVADPRAPVDPILGGAIDWDATLAYRRHLWSLGFAVADAMDTAQRGMGLTADLARELIRRVGAEARAVGGNVGFGAATDALDPLTQHGLGAIERAYAEQIALIEEQHCTAIVMASRALAKAARGADDYARVYANVLAGATTPVILHWLGPMFDPQLAGYWGSDDLDAATETFVAIVRANVAKIDGIKISLLDAQREVDLRRRLPDGVRVYTGDDFNYPELIAGDGAKAFAKHAKRLQEVIGEQHDAVNAQRRLRPYCEDPARAFAAGELFALEKRVADESGRAWRGAWEASARRRLRFWR